VSGAIQASVGASIGLGGVILILLGIGAYFLPTILGARRKVVNVGSVFAINLLLGWTLIGWAIALAMALRTNPPHAYQQYWTGPGPNVAVAAPAPVSAGPPPGWYSDPSGSPTDRWWDGTKWTEHVQTRNP